MKEQKAGCKNRTNDGKRKLKKMNQKTQSGNRNREKKQKTRWRNRKKDGG